jgi:hypothetical protein
MSDKHRCTPVRKPIGLGGVGAVARRQGRSRGLASASGTCLVAAGQGLLQGLQDGLLGAKDLCAPAAMQPRAEVRDEGVSGVMNGGGSGPSAAKSGWAKRRARTQRKGAAIGVLCIRVLVAQRLNNGQSLRHGNVLQGHRAQPQRLQLSSPPPRPGWWLPIPEQATPSLPLLSLYLLCASSCDAHPLR